MKICQLLRKHWVDLGVEPFQSLQKDHSMIMFCRRLWAFIFLITFLTLSTAFLLYESKAPGEYVDSFYASATLILILTILTITLWKMEKLFELIESVENLIEQRKMLLYFVLVLYIVNIIMANL